MMVTAAAAATVSGVGVGGDDFSSDWSVATYLFIWSR